MSALHPHRPPQYRDAPVSGVCFWGSGLTGKLGKVLCAVGVGLLVACGLGAVSLQPGSGAVPRLQIPSPDRAVRRPPFQIAGDERAFNSLEAAIASAPSNGTIIIAGPGPFRVRPLSLHGKALTLSAAPGARPVLEKSADAHTPPWQGMLNTDRLLRLEGIELRLARGGDGPLIAADGGALALLGCKLLGAARTAAVAVGHAPVLDMQSCHIDGGPALAVELGGIGSCRISLEACTLTSRQSDACALSLWSPEHGTPTDVSLRLEGNTVYCSRVLSLRGPRGNVCVQARGNTLSFREALLSFIGGPADREWRDCLVWRGEGNQFGAGRICVMVDGELQVLDDQQSW